MRIFALAPLLFVGCLYNQTAYDENLEELTDHDGDGYAQRQDCNDTDGAIHPGAEEIPGDGYDQDCNGLEDCYVDGDNDGFGKDELKVGDDMDCTNRSGESDNADDCDDSEMDIYPDAEEIPNNGIDEDCFPDSGD